jgi:NTE family protein
MARGATRARRQGRPRSMLPAFRRPRLRTAGRSRHRTAGRPASDRWPLDIPLAICATDLFRRCEVTFTRGVVWPRILASTSIPGIYPALRGPDSYLVDGAVLNPVPSRQCREFGAGVVIGVRLTGKNTSPRDDLDANPSRPLAPETILRCLEIMHNRLSELSKNEADVPLEVCLERGGLRDFDRSAEIIRAGYEGAIAAVPELSAAIPYLVRP